MWVVSFRALGCRAQGTSPFHLHPLCMSRRSYAFFPRPARLVFRSERLEGAADRTVSTGGHFLWPTARRGAWVAARCTCTQVAYNFQNVLMGTFLTCKYREGEGVFRSDSITTLAILKEGITREATTRKQQIGIAVDVADHSVSVLFGFLLLAWVAPVSCRLDAWVAPVSCGRFTSHAGPCSVRSLLALGPGAVVQTGGAPAYYVCGSSSMFLTRKKVG